MCGWNRQTTEKERGIEKNERKNPLTVSNNAPRPNERMALEITKPFEYSLGISVYEIPKKWFVDIRFLCSESMCDAIIR